MILNNAHIKEYACIIIYIHIIIYAYIKRKVLIGRMFQIYDKYCLKVTDTATFTSTVTATVTATEFVLDVMEIG